VVNDSSSVSNCGFLDDPGGQMNHTAGVHTLNNTEKRALKARAQRIKATVKVGKAGLSPEFLQSLNEALRHNELLKVKFDSLKDQKKDLTPLLAEKTGSHLVTRVGNVVVLYRPKPEENAEQGQEKPEKTIRPSKD
jgi:RNA-binding protein